MSLADSLARVMLAIPLASALAVSAALSASGVLSASGLPTGPQMAVPTESPMAVPMEGASECVMVTTRGLESGPPKEHERARVLARSRATRWVAL